MKLPDKPSELIRLALKDLALVENDPRYEVNMSNWHLNKGDICSVCLAGSIMAKSLSAEIFKTYVPMDFYEVQKLRAINYFRMGRVEDGLFHLNIIDCPIEEREHTNYSWNRDLFLTQMEDLAAEFETYNL